MTLYVNGRKPETEIVIKCRKCRSCRDVLFCRPLPCPAFACSFLENRTETHQKTRIFFPTEPLKSLEKKGKTQTQKKKTRNASQGKKQGIPKKQRKDRVLVFADSPIFFLNFGVFCGWPRLLQTQIVKCSAQRRHLEHSDFKSQSTSEIATKISSKSVEKRVEIATEIAVALAREQS